MGFFSGLLAAAPIVGPLVGGALSLLGGKKRNEAQADLSEDQMKFQERMSNTAYQRSMADMRSAGLNPILASKLGAASSPVGSMAQIQDVVTPALNTALQVARTSADVAVKGVEVDLKKADTKVREMDVMLKQSSTELNKVKAALQRSLIPGAEAIAVVTKNVANLLKAIDSMVGQTKFGYQESIKEAQAMIKDWVDESLLMMREEVPSILDRTINEATDLGDDVKKWFLDLFKD